MRAADPTRRIVALSGDYDFQFMIEELAVGAQFKLPYIHVVVNNAYLGLIRQAQRGFEMDYCVQLGFDNINAPELDGYGVDHVAVVEGLGCKAIRVHTAGGDRAGDRSRRRSGWREYQVPVVIEIILERVTNIAMGTEIDNVIEFEELAEQHRRRADRGGRDARLIDRKPHAAVDHAEVRRQPDDALQRARLPRPLRAAAARRLRGVEFLFPYAFPRERDRASGSTQHGLALVLHNLPAGDWEAGERGIACQPDRVDEFRDGVGRAIEYATALGCRSSTASPASRRRASTRDAARATFVANLRFAAGEARGRGHRGC